MAYRCGDCEKDFESVLPDGSCPDCYGLDAVIKTASLDNESGRIHASLSAAPSVTRQLMVGSDRDILSKMDDIFEFANDHIRKKQQASSYVAPHHRGGNPQAGIRQGLPLVPPRDHGTAAPRPYQQPVARAMSPPSGRAPAPRSIPYPYDDVPVAHHGQANCRDSVAPTAVVPTVKKLKATSIATLSGELSAAVLEFRGPFTTALDACLDPDLLFKAASELQTAVETVEYLQKQFERRTVKVLGGEISVKQMTYGLDRAGANSIPGEPKQRRERRSAPNCNTVVVKDLPHMITRGDLFDYFAKFCESLADVKNVVTDDSRNRGCAMITLAHESIVRKILSAPEEHKIKNKVVSVSWFDEEKLIRRGADYEIHAAGLSSYMSEESFEDYLIENFGEVERLDFRPNLDAPTVNNAWACITFVDEEINQSILEAKFLEYRGRKIRCKPHVSHRVMIENKKRDGTFEALGPRRERPSFANLSHRPLAQAVGNAQELTSEPTKRKDANEKQERPAGYTCVICADNEVRIMLRPCGHFCLCERCSDDVGLQKCPYCSHAIDHKEKIFVAGF
ncbi:hypothetical protein BV898_14452 [Hypsibius exemplaris]|uniref:RING-type domain-containing protein n=1 Tax=Hypsibius exemplaris TaxID=2072580 RepID=A0A9X6NAK1_HYPEX|nr:hypothetical protein BV898_14452 [Hypsibius exemplaris]